MKKIAIMVAFCLLSVSCTSKSLEDAIALYEGEDWVEIIEKLVAEDINATTYGDEYTSLMYASAYGYTEIVKSLIADGANLEAKSRGFEDTALILTAKSGEAEVVKILIEAGADIGAKDNEGRTALMAAAERGHTEVIKILLTAGANIDAKDDDGATALMWATWNGHTEIATLLTEAVHGFYTVHGTGLNYYEIPYVGEKSELTKRIGDTKNKLIEKYNFPIIVNNFLDDGSSITGKLVSVYREDIPNKNGDTALSVYRLMYTVSNDDSNGITKLSFIEGEEIERQNYGQAIYITDDSETNAELFSRDIYFGRQDLTGVDPRAGVTGNNAYFKVIDDTIISVLYTLQSSSNQTANNHEAILYRNEIENIQDKTVLCQIEASFPLIDRNNPYRYTIQSALDGNPATSFVEATDDNLMTIQFDFTKDHTFTDIAIINGYAQTENLYYFNNRVKRISFPEISTSYEHSYTLDGNILAHQEFTFENTIAQSSATIDVIEIYEDTKYSDTCLAELDIKTDEGWLFGLE